MKRQSNTTAPASALEGREATAQAKAEHVNSAEVTNGGELVDPTQSLTGAATTKAKNNYTPEAPVLSRRELEKWGNRVWRVLIKKVGVGLFADILLRAVSEMLESGITRQTAFNQNGNLTDEAADYVCEAFFESISSHHFGDWGCATDLLKDLLLAVDLDVFGYFEAQATTNG